MPTEIQIDANKGDGLDYRYGRDFDVGWFRAVVLKAKPHEGAKKMNFRVSFGVDAQFTDPNSKQVLPAGLRVDHYAPVSGDGDAGTNRRVLFAALGYADIDKTGGKVDLDEWYGCECMVQIKAEEYQGEKRPKIGDLRPIVKNERTRRDMPKPKIESEIEQEVAFP